jgi:signal transduction histidine kinase
LLEDEERAGLRRDPIVPASDLRGAAERMEAITREIMAVARPEGRTTRMQPVRIVVSDLVGQVQRRLRALVFGRPINASVFSNREAPEHVEIDALVLDRILDNLLTNAARYTVRGSILVEVTGTPGFLVFKVSDTGRGIAEDAIAGIFQPRGSDPTTRAAGGHGLGLSIVVGLLAEIGGRLEVLSKPGVGTTFWVYLPAAGGAAVRVEPAAARPADGNAEQLLHRVVRIRRSNG